MYIIIFFKNSFVYVCKSNSKIGCFLYITNILRRNFEPKFSLCLLHNMQNIARFCT